MHPDIHMVWCTHDDIWCDARMMMYMYIRCRGGGTTPHSLSTRAMTTLSSPLLRWLSISSHMLVSEPRKPPSHLLLWPHLFTYKQISPILYLPWTEPSINDLFSISLTSCLGLWWPSQAWSNYSIALNLIPFTLLSSLTSKWCHLPCSYFVELIGSKPPVFTSPCRI